MTRIENDCVDCGLPCMGNSCPNRNVLHCYCDMCKNEAYPLYKYYKEITDKSYKGYDCLELCEECLLSQFEIVEGSEE